MEQEHGIGSPFKRAKSRMSRYALILIAVLIGCSKPKPAEKQLSEAELKEIMRSLPDQYSPLLAAKYHISPEAAHSITTDYRVHEIFSGWTTGSPTPATETMQQTIERLSRTHNVPPDVVASLIVDYLQLTRSD